MASASDTVLSASFHVCVLSDRFAKSGSGECEAKKPDLTLRGVHSQVYISIREIRRLTGCYELSSPVVCRPFPRPFSCYITSISTQVITRAGYTSVRDQSVMIISLLLHDTIQP